MAAIDLVGQARVGLTNLENVTINEVLAKSSGIGGQWNASASSADFIEGNTSQRKGIFCGIPPRDSQYAWMMGLVSVPGGQQQQEEEEAAIAQSVDWKSLTYAACVASDLTLWVYENGKHCGYFDSVQSGDRIEIVLNSECPCRVEYRINGKLQYQSKTPVVFPLFPKICTSGPGPVAEGFSWILGNPLASPIGRMEEPTTQIEELETRLTELQSQLQMCKEANQALHVRFDEKEAANEALQAVVNQVQKEKAELQGQLEADREASRAAGGKKEHAMWPQGHNEAPCTSMDDRAEAQPQEEQPEAEAAAAAVAAPRALIDEKLELQILAMRLQRDIQIYRGGSENLMDENARLKAEAKEMHAEIEELRRQLLQSCETSTEAWEDAGSSAALSSAGGQAE